MEALQKSLKLNTYVTIRLGISLDQLDYVH